MRKFIALLLCTLLAAGMLSACAAGGAEPAGDGKLRIVAEAFPEYDWVLRVLGDAAADAEVTMLQDSGVDLHSYQPTAEDILRISGCDLFVYVGGESDKWVRDALKETSNPKRIAIGLLDALGDHAKEEETVEGMQEEESEPENGEREAEDGPEYDEHVWLSLRCASVLTGRIAEALAELDPARASMYAANAAAYKEALAALDARYAAVVEAAPVKTLLFGDRFPFRYLTEDYGLTYYAAFVGCSAETEASFRTVTFLARKVDELSLHTVLTLENSDRRIAETIVRNTKTKDQQILSIDSMQSVTQKDVRNGVTYLSVMEKNLAVLEDALK